MSSGKEVVILILAALIVAGLVATIFKAASVDRGECLASHNTIIMQPRYMTTCNNNICRSQLIGMFPVPMTVCDKWEFPEGRPM